MNQKAVRNLIVETVICAAFYVGSFLASRGGVHVLSALLLIVYALRLYICPFTQTRNLVDMKNSEANPS